MRAFRASRSTASVRPAAPTACGSTSTAGRRRCGASGSTAGGLGSRRRTARPSGCEDSYIGVSAGDGVTPRGNTSGIIFLGGSNHVVAGSNLISANSRSACACRTSRARRCAATGSGRTPPARRRSPTVWATSSAPSAASRSRPRAAGASGIVIGGSGAGDGNLISGNGRSGIDFYPSTVARSTTPSSGATGSARTPRDGGDRKRLARHPHPRFQRQRADDGHDDRRHGGGPGQHDRLQRPRRRRHRHERARDPENVRNAIRGNAIYSNGRRFPGLGIDLERPNGVNANDADDVDTGANDIQNFPRCSPRRRTALRPTSTGDLTSTPYHDYPGLLLGAGLRPER